MGNFTKDIVKTYEFDGDQVTVVMSVLKRVDAMELAPLIDDSSDLKNQTEFFSKAVAMLPNYIKSIDGIVDSNGDAVGMELVVGPDASSYFIELVSEIVSDLIGGSFLSSDSVKKSEGLQEDSLME